MPKRGSCPLSGALHTDVQAISISSKLNHANTDPRLQISYSQKGRTDRKRDVHKQGREVVNSGRGSNKASEGVKFFMKMERSE
ncbi:predicted protein [Sclerotinia sclerotiorum 1980 UF-70]|uniref:Uncharacterized protein n=1 Tax=Sclerotinia sclerotiorum (strain ATCC 18683 / 1980 / Ss-1) TaxID=665079 RepID=A7F0N7_SCLS1|nr:predicted protein [Sclerotinia sclerotiorum 1980 UF-70]EDN95279.1 predicted protein [Sclerotinia sclerotiorum 1980 UF-70]